MNYFRSHLYNKLRFGWQLGLFLIFLFGFPRFIFVLKASITGDYGATSVIFLIMMFTPFVLLNKAGRRLIGIKSPEHNIWLLYSLALGIAAGAVIFMIGDWLYRETLSNWFVYIANSYRLPGDALVGSNRLIYFIIFSVIGMTFSPIGEELLYRGLIHQCFVPRFGENRASIIDSLAFGLTHLAHFGLVFSFGKWMLLPVPALLWVLLTFLSSRLFYYCKQKSGSIYGAILCHAGFNLAMTYFIFYHIL